MNDEENKSFSVKDKRRFDADGNEKSESAHVGSTQVEPSINISAATDSTQNANADVSELNFSTFVMSLAMQALMQLGEIAPPDGTPITRDKQAARQSIDILSMLKEKTVGNLSAEEANMLEEILHSLRLSFIKH